MMDRKTAPQTTKTEEISYLDPIKLCTANGISFYYMPNPSSEAAKLDLLFKAGSSYIDPSIGASTTALLMCGAHELTTAVIQDRVDELGGYFDANLSSDYAHFTIFGLNEVMLELTTFIEDCIYNANFPAQELETYVLNRKQGFKLSFEKVGFLVQRAFQSHLFNGSSYAKMSNPEDYDQLERSQLIDFLNSNFKKGLQRITFVGHLSDEDLNALVSLFDRWENTAETAQTGTISPLKGPVSIPKKDALQVALRIGKLLIDKKHPDYHKMTVLNTIFGDYFGSRLMSNIREDKGYTYGIGSYLAENKNSGYMVIATEVGKEFLEDTLVQIKIEFERLKETLVSEDELELVKNYLLGQILKSADGPFSMMDLFTAVEIHGLDYDFYNDGLKEILSVTPQDLLETAQRQYNWDEMLVVTAGEQLK